MMGEQNTWITFRARNAAQRGVWIVGTGLAAAMVIGALLLLLPRERDRQLERRLAALPRAPDSLPMIQQRDSLREARRLLATAEGSGANARPDTASEGGDGRGVEPVVQRPQDLTVGASGGVRDSALSARPAPLADSLAIDLMTRVTRARDVPLTESYRALSDAPLLRDDPTARAIRDSIDRLDREREARAALGGPDARYAAVTAQLTALGNALIRVAGQRLARNVRTNIVARQQRATVPVDTLRAPTESSSPFAEFPLSTDSLQEALTRRIQAAESLLAVVRLANVQYQTQRASVQEGFAFDVPRLSIVLAALAVGLTCGYGVAFIREVRHPTVGDVAEVERLSSAPVMLYTGALHVARHALTPLTVPPSRRGVLRMVDRESDTFVRLHLALTGVDDVVTHVDVLAEDGALSSAIALGVGSTAARESRAVLLVDPLMAESVLAPLFQPPARKTRSAAPTVPDPPANVVHTVSFDRDCHLDVALATNVAEAYAASTENRYDLVMHLSRGSDDDIRQAGDVIVCARQGTTTLEWLSQAAYQARRRQQRIRALVLWGRNARVDS